MRSHHRTNKYTRGNNEFWVVHESLMAHTKDISQATGSELPIVQLMHTSISFTYSNTLTPSAIEMRTTQPLCPLSTFAINSLYARNSSVSQSRWHLSVEFTGEAGVQIFFSSSSNQSRHSTMLNTSVRLEWFVVHANSAAELSTLVSSCERLTVYMRTSQH